MRSRPVLFGRQRIFFWRFTLNQVVHLMPHTIKAFALSDVGLVRQNNEDAWEILPNLNFFILADGMGGHQAGEIAANEAVSNLAEMMSRKTQAEYDRMSTKEVEECLKQAIIHVNAHIFKMGRANPDLRGMGTTLCAIFFHPKGVIVAHVGDSRIYRLHEEILQLLTRDHSLFCELVDQGQIAQDQANEFLYGNIITKAIGTEPKVDPAVKTIEAVVGDVYLMCSDGLSDLLNINEINEIVATSVDFAETAENLVSFANKRGGRDNITVVLAKITS